MVSFRRPTVRNEIRIMDLWWISGEFMWRVQSFNCKSEWRVRELFAHGCVCQPASQPFSPSAVGTRPLLIYFAPMRLPFAKELSRSIRQNNGNYYWWQIDTYAASDHWPRTFHSELITNLSARDMKTETSTSIYLFPIASPSSRLNRDEVQNKFS